MKLRNVNISNSRRVKVEPPLFQYDYGQKLVITGIQLPFAYEVLFGNPCGELKPVIGDASGVLIPDEFLQTGQPIVAYIYLHNSDDDGETEYVINIPVNPREERDDGEITPVEQSVITQAIATLNEAIEITGDYADAAHTSELNAATYAETAAESAQAARESEEASSDYAERAENAAIAAEVSASDAETSANNAAESASSAGAYASAAEQSAAQSGYLWFDIHEDGHLYLDRTPNTQVNFWLQNGHLFVGD